MVSRVLTSLRGEFPELEELKTVDVLRHPRTALKAGVTMIPTLERDGERLSGFMLSKEQIRNFLSRTRAAAPSSH